jgi:hypothetical protein
VLNLDFLIVESRFSLNLPTFDNGFYRPDSQNGKGQDIKNCYLAQVKYTVEVDIKIEWNSDDYD